MLQYNPQAPLLFLSSETIMNDYWQIAEADIPLQNFVLPMCIVTLWCLRIL